MGGMVVDIMIIEMVRNMRGHTVFYIGYVIIINILQLWSDR